MPKTIRPRLLLETIGDVTVIGFAEQALVAEEAVREIADHLSALAEGVGPVKLLLDFQNVQFMSGRMLAVLVWIAQDRAGRRKYEAMRHHPASSGPLRDHPAPSLLRDLSRAVERALRISEAPLQFVRPLITSGGASATAPAASSCRRRDHLNGVAGLAVEAGGDAEQCDHLADVAERPAKVAGGAGLALGAAVLGELGPVERPGLLDGVRLDPAGELGVLVDQLDGDRALGGAVGMVLDGGQGGAAWAGRCWERADFQLEAFFPPLLDLATPWVARSCAVSGSTQGPIRRMTTVMLSRPPRRLARLTR